MNLTWHIVAKDFRRLRVPISVWMLAYVVQFAVGARLLSGAVFNPGAFQTNQATCQFLSLIQFVVGFMLVPELIFDDPLVGTRAFWPTRPISGARLLGSKLLTCALLFGLLPSLISLPWWLYCGYGVSEIAHASLQTMALQVIPVALGLLIASLTGNLSRFIGWTFLLVVGVALASITLLTPVSTHLYFHGLDQLADSATNHVRLHLLSLIALLGCAVVVGLQFLTRMLARSLVVLACLLGLLAAEATWWPLDPAARLEVSSALPDAPDLDNRVTIQPKEGPRLHLEGDRSDKSDGFIFGTFEVGNATPETLLHYDPPIFEWRWPDGTVSRERGIILGTPRWEQAGSQYQVESVVPHKMRSEEDWEKSTLYQDWARNGTKRTWEEIYKRPVANHAWDYYVEVPRTDGLKMLTDPSTFTLELRGEKLRPSLEAEVPLESGSVWSRGSVGFRIARSEWSDRENRLEVHIVEHSPALGNSSYNLFGPSNPYDSDSTYVAVNRTEGESTSSVLGTTFAVAIHIATVSIELRQLVFAGPSNRTIGRGAWDNDRWTGPSYKDWFSHATLARVTEVPDGSFTRRMPIEKFTLTLDTFSKAQ
ncbi:MAG TPA: hypothetical protein VII43_05140 [Opitutaceae bacterium]